MTKKQPLTYNDIGGCYDEIIKKNGEKYKMSETRSEKLKSILSRIPIYIAGAVLLGFGIVLCVRSEMGVSPINSIPYVISHIVPLSLGTISILFYLVNIILQLILSKRKDYLGIILQLPVSLLFGLVIDMWDALLPSAGSIWMRILCLCGSLFFTAFGIMLIVAMHLVPDPPTGTVQVISHITGKEIGTIKVIYDCSCVVISLLTGFLGTHQIVGFGIATIVSALCIGRVLALLQKTIGKRLKRYFPEAEA